MFVTPDMVRMNIEDEAQYNPIFAFLDREFDNWAVNEKLAKVAHFVWRVLVFGDLQSESLGALHCRESCPEAPSSLRRLPNAI